MMARPEAFRRPTEVPDLYERLDALLREARARLRWTRAVCSASAALPLALSGIALGSWSGLAGIWLLVAAACAGIAMTVLVTIARTPAVPDVAATLDARLQLADLLHTAVRMLERRDGVARFIVQDASAKLTREAITATLPYRQHPRAAAGWAFALLSAGVWMTVPAPTPPRTIGSSGPTQQLGAGTAPREAGNQPTADAASRSASAAGAARAATPPADRANQTVIARSADAPAGRAGRAELQTQTTVGSASPGASGTEPPGQTGATRGAEPRGGAAGQTSAASVGAGGDGRGLAATSAPGGGSAAGSPRAAGAGGVQRGRLTGPAATDNPADPASPGVSSAGLARARAAAEAAIAHDDVPPRHRAYVRDYYRAVGRLGEP